MNAPANFAASPASLAGRACNALPRRIARTAGPRPSPRPSPGGPGEGEGPPKGGTTNREDTAAGPLAQYVWSPTYVDELILRDRDTDGQTAGLEERLYAQTNALHSVTSTVTAVMMGAGDVAERQEFTGYGVVAVLNADWSTDAEGSDFGWVVGHQGTRLEPRTGYLHHRNRDYIATLQRWAQMDPNPADNGGMYVDGLNAYQMARGSPVRYTDASGLNVAVVGQPGHAGIQVQVWDLDPGTCREVVVGVLQVDYHAKGFMGTASQAATGNVVTGTEGQLDWLFMANVGHTSRIAVRTMAGPAANDKRLLSALRAAMGMYDISGSVFSLEDGKTLYATPPEWGWSELTRAIRERRTARGSVDAGNGWQSYNVNTRQCYTFVARMIDVWGGSNLNGGSAFWTFDGLMTEIDAAYPAAVKGVIVPSSGSSSSGSSNGGSSGS